MRMVNMNVREDGRKRNIFEKVNEIEEQVYANLPEIKGDRKKLINILCHCRRFYEGKLHWGRRSVKANLKKVRDLTRVEREVYDALLRHGHNPSTTYRWFLATRVPEDIKEKLMHDRISVKKALVISANRKKTKDCKLGLLMIEEIRDAIRRL